MPENTEEAIDITEIGEKIIKMLGLEDLRIYKLTLELESKQCPVITVDRYVLDENGSTIRKGDHLERIIEKRDMTLAQFLEMGLL